MKLPRRKFLHLAAGATALPALPRFARAQAYPTRPVRYIVSAPPDGSQDILARLTSQWLSERLSQQFVIENRRTNTATEAVVRAPADGYTLLSVAPPSAINATLYNNLSFNFIRDIAPVAGIFRGPYVMLVHPSVQAKTIPEFIAYAKSNPGKLNMASAGTGSGPHVAGELFKMMTGQHGPCAVSRWSARAHRSAGRAGTSCIWRRTRINRIHQNRKAAGLGSDHYGAF